MQLALDEPTPSPRERATRFTDAERHFVSESSAYRILKAHDLITGPAFIVVKAADEFKDKTTAPNQLRQPTSPISRSSAGDGIIPPPSSMTARATSSPGSCVRRWRRLSTSASMLNDHNQIVLEEDLPNRSTNIHQLLVAGCLELGDIYIGRQLGKIADAGL
jgi:hypothetical protein